MKPRKNPPTGRLVGIAMHDLFSIFISVSGGTISGKSTVAFIIEKALRDSGAIVTVETDDANPDAYRKTLESRKSMMKGKHVIIMESRDQSSCHQ